MRLDHIAFRTNDRLRTAQELNITLGYSIDPDLPEGFDVQFEDGTNAKCLVLQPPEGSYQNRNIHPWPSPNEYHSPPEIFVSDGSSNSIVSEWVNHHGPGVHHLAYEVKSVEGTMTEWRKKGIEFTTENPLTCPGLIQAFTKPSLHTGIIIEIIERTTHGFCKDNVKDLMESTK